MRFRSRGFFFEADDAIVLVEFRDAVAFRIAHPISENGRAARALHGALHRFGQAMTVEDVVAENQATRLAGEKVASDHECLREAVRRGLHRIAYRDTPLRSVAEKA